MSRSTRSPFRWFRSSDQKAQRSASLRLAIIASAASKAFGLALQAIAMPLVLRSLGEHQFELYLLLTAILATIALTQMGTGPGLTQGIARANAAGDLRGQASLLGAAFRLTGLTTFIGGGAILVVVYLVPPDILFGPAFLHDRPAIVAAARVCTWVLMLQFLSSVVDSALAGFQEQVLSYLGAASSNIIGIGLLIVVCRTSPSIVNVVLVIYGVPVIFRALNLILLLRRRPHLRSAVFGSCRGAYGSLLNVGIAFWLIQLAGIFEEHGGTYLLAHLSSTSATDFFGVAYKFLALAGAVIAVISQPLWPAIADAFAHGDVDWIRRSYAKARLLVTGYSIVVAILLFTRGAWVFEHLTAIKGPNAAFFALLGMYFVANVWTHLFYTAMMGMSVIWKLAAVLLLENVVMIGLGAILVPRFGVTGMALAYLAANLALPVWYLPRLMSRVMRRPPASRELG